MDSEFLLVDSGFPLVGSYSQMISHLYVRISNCVEYLDKEQSYKNSKNSKFKEQSYKNDLQIYTYHN